MECHIGIRAQRLVFLVLVFLLTFRVPRMVSAGRVTRARTQMQEPQLYEWYFSKHHQRKPQNPEQKQNSWERGTRIWCVPVPICPGPLSEKAVMLQLVGPYSEPKHRRSRNLCFSNGSPPNSILLSSIPPRFPCIQLSAPDQGYHGSGASSDGREDPVLGIAGCARVDMLDMRIVVCDAQLWDLLKNR